MNEKQALQQLKGAGTAQNRKTSARQARLRR